MIQWIKYNYIVCYTCFELLIGNNVHMEYVCWIFNTKLSLICWSKQLFGRQWKWLKYATQKCPVAYNYLGFVASRWNTNWLLDQLNSVSSGQLMFFSLFVCVFNVFDFIREISFNLECNLWSQHVSKHCLIARWAMKTDNK